MTDAARSLFDGLDAYGRLQELIENGEAEGLHLECKAPVEPRLTKELRAKLAEAVSGFGNTAGGVILWGVSTTRHAHSGLDVLTQLEPLGAVRTFARQIERSVPTLTTPAVTNSITKVLHDSAGSSRGIAATYIPQSLGDPLQTNADSRFYFRNGDEFTVLPFPMLKRLFAASETPDLAPIFNERLVRLEADGRWYLPVAVQNRSSAVGEYVKLVLRIENPDACEAIDPQGFADLSSVNPGEHIFVADPAGVIHRGLNLVVGSVRVRMKVAKRAKRVLRLHIVLLANRMRGRQWSFTVQLAKSGFSVTLTGDEYLY